MLSTKQLLYNLIYSNVLTHYDEKIRLTIDEMIYFGIRYSDGNVEYYIYDRFGPCKYIHYWVIDTLKKMDIKYNSFDIIKEDNGRMIRESDVVEQKIKDGDILIINLK
jgi:hypothetical protein